MKKLVGQDNAAKNSLIINLRAFLVSFGANTASSYIGVYGVLLGSSPIEMGMLQAFSNSLSNAGQLFWGRLSDRTGYRRPWIFAASIALAINWILMAFIRTPYELIISYSIMSLISAMIAVNWFSLLTDISRYGSRGSFLSYINNISGTGNLISLLAMVFLLHGISRDQLVVPFSLGSVSYIASAILISKVKEVRRKTVLTKNIIRTVSEARNNRYFFNYFMAMNVQGFFWSMAWPIFPITIVSVMHFSLPMVSALTATNIVFTMLIQRAVGNLADRINRVPLIFANRIMLGFIPLMYGYFSNFLEFMGMEVYSGIASGLQNVVMNSYLMDIVPEGHRGEYISIINGFNGIIYFAGSMSGGLILSNFLGYLPLHAAVAITFTIIAAGRFTSSFLFLGLKEPEARRGRPNPFIGILSRVFSGLPSGGVPRQR
ncbi:hypothetical protein [Thermoplasma volcanium GSS1]|uniref:Major facilitator superfamily (MFS) profile domain-containing protein n=1 Tax=Thermoplasma volcanium (strain ATCC 51530 / DSM 4299 / JCM 9571 / NBRC 15438 / GSS1) TaxID=273116 RepID=Q97AH4_THEVO|nr:MFS transporter [Thermoplasma volcanium]BAB59978.1 hypothetical protein [Thermoplasma volcanium GSS1]